MRIIVHSQTAEEFTFIDEDKARETYRLLVIQYEDCDIVLLNNDGSVVETRLRIIKPV